MKKLLLIFTIFLSSCTKNATEPIKENQEIKVKSFELTINNDFMELDSIYCKFSYPNSQQKGQLDIFSDDETNIQIGIILYTDSIFISEGAYYCNLDDEIKDFQITLHTCDSLNIHYIYWMPEAELLITKVDNNNNLISGQFTFSRESPKFICNDGKFENIKWLYEEKDYTNN